MIAILSIKPKYANLILNGKKRYEFRKRAPKSKVEKVYLYSSSPTQKIVGYFTTEETISGPPKNVWEKTKHAAGIEREDYFKYFKNKKIAHAIKVKKKVRLRSMEPKEIFPNFTIPQSFIYLDITKKRKFNYVLSLFRKARKLI